MKEKKQEEDAHIQEAKKLIEYLFAPHNFDMLNLTPRKREVLEMKRTYGLTNKQIAEKLGITEARVKDNYDYVLQRTFRLAYLAVNEANQSESLQKEVHRLKKENEDYKIRYEAMSAGDKKTFKELDIVLKPVSEVGFSKKTEWALEVLRIYTVEQLLQYRLSSLLLRTNVTISMVEEIRIFAMNHRLKMKW